MRRTVQAAYVGDLDSRRRTLDESLADAARRIDGDAIDFAAIDRGVGPASLTDDRYDVVFVDSSGVFGSPNAPFDSAAAAVRAASPASVIVLIADDVGEDRLRDAHNAGLIDWTLRSDFTTDELADALRAARLKIDARRRGRELALARDALAANRTPAMILDRSCRLAFANADAGALIDAGDPFRLTRAGQLVCTTRERTQAVHGGRARAGHQHARSG
ncbi:MAG: hypothetical protein ACFB00_02325, partial [Parvularculaceae bacterium]